MVLCHLPHGSHAGCKPGRQRFGAWREFPCFHVELPVFFFLVRCRFCFCPHGRKKTAQRTFFERAGNTKRRSATPRRPGGESHPQFEPHSRTEGGHGPGEIWRVGPSSILSMADSEAALKSWPCVAFIIRSSLVCLETGNPWMMAKGTDTKAASKSRRWVAFSSGRPWFAWRQGQPVDGDERN